MIPLALGNHSNTTAYAFGCAIFRPFRKCRFAIRFAGAERSSIAATASGSVLKVLP
jgi:hypothetical protein